MIEKKHMLILFIFISIICSGCRKEVIETDSIESEETSRISETDETDESESTSLIDETENMTEKDTEITTEKDTEITMDTNITLEQSNTEAITKVDSPQEVEYYKTKGYILSVEDDIMYVDEVNLGSRSYEGEGEDRKIAYNISEADIDIDESPHSGQLRTALSVDITYYENNGHRYASYIYSDGWEIQPGETYEVVGTIWEISENTIVIRYKDTKSEETFIKEVFDISDAYINTSADIKVDYPVYIYYRNEDGINKAIEIRDN